MIYIIRECDDEIRAYPIEKLLRKHQVFFVQGKADRVVTSIGLHNVESTDGQFVDGSIKFVHAR